MSRSLLRSGVRCSRIVVRNSCIGGNIELIQYIKFIHNVTFHETDLEAASISGNLDTVVLLHEKYGVPCTSHSLAVAIINKHLHVARYLHSRGCALQKTNPISWHCFVACRDVELTEFAIALAHDCPEWMVDMAMDKGCELRRIVGRDKVPSPGRVREACKGGDLELVQLLHSCGAVFDEWCVTYICKSGKMNTIEFVFNQGLKAVKDVADHVAGWAKLEVLQFLYSKGYQATMQGMIAAAEVGALDVVQYLHSLGMPIIPRVVDGAIVFKHREVAIFLYSQGGACSAGLFRFAASHGRSDIFELLSELKQPIPQLAMKTARKYRRQEVLDYLGSVPLVENEVVNVFSSESEEEEMSNRCLLQ